MREWLQRGDIVVSRVIESCSTAVTFLLHNFYSTLQVARHVDDARDDDTNRIRAVCACVCVCVKGEACATYVDYLLLSLPSFPWPLDILFWLPRSAIAPMLQQCYTVTLLHAGNDPTRLML